MADRRDMGRSIDSGVVARVSATLGAVVNPVRDALTSAWFGPQAPLPVVVPVSQQESVEGRQLDYPVGYNLRTQPRSGEEVSFPQMRALADALDILRLVIETRKDQIAAFAWSVRPRDTNLDPDDRCKALQQFFAMPDQEHTWDEWLRMLIEDVLVIDAATLYVRPTRGGAPFAFEPVDGATIKRVIDETGRTPLPPEIAYQQVLKGVTAVDYTRDELIYRPRNLRTHKVYGYSPVEQIIMTVNIALRRQVHQIQYYTEGSTPDLIFQVPPSWSSDQIKKFKTWWDSVLAGNTGNRRGTMFVPDGTKPIDTKEKALKDDYDEWLARIVCYAFSVAPTAFIKDHNRATAQTSQELASQEGLQPMMTWVKSLIDYIIAKHFNAPDLQFTWDTGREVAPLVKAQIHQIYAQNKVMTPDEIRSDLGMDPLTPEERDAAFPAPPPPVIQSNPDKEAGAPAGEEPGDKEVEGAKVAKAQKKSSSTVTGSACACQNSSCKPSSNRFSM